MSKKKTTAKPKTQLVTVPDKVQQDAANQGRSFIAKAERMEIISAVQEETAYNFLKDIKDAINTLESERKKIVKPLNDAKTAVQALFNKKLKAPFERADQILRSKILDFRAEQDRIAEEQAAKLEAKGKVEEAEWIEPEVSATTSVTRRWTFDLVDISKVPRQYLELNAGAVRAAIRNGTREIAGLDIYQEEGLRV